MQNAIFIAIIHFMQQRHVINADKTLRHVTNVKGWHAVALHKTMWMVSVGHLLTDDSA